MSYRTGDIKLRKNRTICGKDTNYISCHGYCDITCQNNQISAVNTIIYQLLTQLYISCQHNYISAVNTIIYQLST